jgi:hypothetical protein
MPSVLPPFCTTSGCTQYCCPSACKSQSDNRQYAAQHRCHAILLLPQHHRLYGSRMLRQLSARGWEPCGHQPYSRGVSGLHMYTTAAAQNKKVASTSPIRRLGETPCIFTVQGRDTFPSRTLSVSLLQVPLMQHACRWRVPLATGTQHAQNLHQCMSTESMPHHLHSRLAATVVWTLLHCCAGCACIHEVASTCLNAVVSFSCVLTASGCVPGQASSDSCKYDHVAAAKMCVRQRRPLPSVAAW